MYWKYRESLAVLLSVFVFGAYGDSRQVRITNKVSDAILLVCRSEIDDLGERWLQRNQFVHFSLDSLSIYTCSARTRDDQLNVEFDVFGGRAPRRRRMEWTMKDDGLYLNGRDRRVNW